MPANTYRLETKPDLSSNSIHNGNGLQRKRALPKALVGYVNRKRRLKTIKRNRERALPKLRISTLNSNHAFISNIEPDSTESANHIENRDDDLGEIRSQRMRKQVELFNISAEEKRKKNIKPKTISIKTEGKSKPVNTILKHFPVLADSDTSSRSASVMSDYMDEEASCSNKIPYLGKEVTLHPVKASKSKSNRTNPYNDKNIMHVCKYCDQIYFDLKSLAVHQVEHMKLKITKLNGIRFLEQRLRRVNQLNIAGKFTPIYPVLLCFYFRHNKSK